MLPLFLSEPRLRGVEIGSPDWFRIQGELIHARPLLKQNYDLWADLQVRDEASVPQRLAGKILEIGSGASYLKKVRPDVITSDIVGGQADMVVDAQAIPFENDSLRAIFLTHSFHHIPDVRKFLREAERTLAPGGVVSLIDIAHSPFARFFFSKIHPEPYDDSREAWSLGEMEANQALVWMVFDRDRAIFEREFPGLTIERITLLQWFGYLISGGVTQRNLIPRWALPIAFALDRVLAALNPIFSLHVHITLRKKG